MALAIFCDSILSTGLFSAGSFLETAQEIGARVSQSSSAESQSDKSAQGGTYKAWLKSNETPISKSDWSR